VTSEFYDDYKLVVGIDLGTTYSGFNFAFREGKPRNPYRLWPGGGNDRPYPKTRTYLLSTAECQEIDSWGNAARRRYNFKRDQEPWKWFLLSRFKLFLNDPTRRQPDGKVIFTAPNGDQAVEFDLVTVIASYLKELTDYALTQILGPQDDLDPSKDIKWVLTVPANWDDFAKGYMRQAAIAAGLIRAGVDEKRLEFIAEPEAAACFVTKNDEDATRFFASGRSGRTFMIVDAGGGTVDVTIYQVNPDGRTLKELAKGAADYCGSTFVDDEFRAYLRQLFGPELFDLLIRETTLGDDYLLVMDRWEGEKCAFNPAETFGHIKMELPLGIHAHLQEPRFHTARERICSMDPTGYSIVLTNEQMAEFFRPVLDKCVEVVTEVLENARAQMPSAWQCDMLLLVGGFSYSAELRQRFKQEFAGCVGDILEVSDPGQAVVTGATWFGLDRTIIRSRIVRRTYGIETTHEYRAGIDGDRLLVVNGRKLADKIFAIHCVNGMSIDAGDRFPRIYHPVDPRQTSVIVKLVTTDKLRPDYTDESGVVCFRELELPWPGSGLDRELKVEFSFGDTEVKVTCQTEGETKTVYFKPEYGWQ